MCGGPLISYCYNGEFVLPHDIFASQEGLMIKNCLCLLGS